MERSGMKAEASIQNEIKIRRLARSNVRASALIEIGCACMHGES